MPPGGVPFFVSVVSGLAAERQHNFAMFVMERRKGRPHIVTRNRGEAGLTWRYSPTKQSGENARRKAEFLRLAGADTLTFPLPDSDIAPFAAAVARALELRRHADAAGGASDDGTDEQDELDADDTSVEAQDAAALDFAEIASRLRTRSLSFPAELVASYLLALQAKRFVLLTGISGTGKTQLALEVARAFASDARDEDEGAAEKMIAPDMLKRGRFVVPASLAKELDALNGEGKRLDVRLLGRPPESMAVYKDAARPSLLIVLLSGEAKRVFKSSLRPGDRLALRRETVAGKEVLVADKPATIASPVAHNHQLVAVRPDWTDARALLGFYNPLTGAYAPTPTLQLILRAQEEMTSATTEGRAPHPFFLIFDEMNLARVEHYFSDFLSAMESGDALALHDSDEVDEEVPRRLALPPNLFLVGTVNVDETTYMFSPKVLDRAFVLEFNDVDLRLLSGGVQGDGLPSPLTLSKLSALKLMGRADEEEWRRFESLCDGQLRELLGEIHSGLAQDNRHFGYRVAREIARFVVLASEQTDGSPEALIAAFDVAVLAKVLPKLNGTQAELQTTLERLVRLASGSAGDAEPEVSDAATSSAPPLGQRRPRLVRTEAKLRRMQKRLHAHGFVSFIE